MQRQNVQHISVLIRVLLYDCYFDDRCSLCCRLTYLAAAAAAAIACVAALTFLGLQSPGTATYSRRERGLVTSTLEVIFIMGYFYNEMRYTNLPFTAAYCIQPENDGVRGQRDKIATTNFAAVGLSAVNRA